MKTIYAGLLLFLIMITSCKSPEEKLENLLNDFRQDICTAEPDQTSKMVSGSMDSLLQSYRQVCQHVSTDQELFARENVALSRVEISDESASAVVNGKYPVYFVKKDKRWKISSYPDFQARLTAVTYLYALDQGNYSLARQLSTAQSHEVIDLMQQFDQMSADTRRTDTVELSIKVEEVVLNDDGAEVHYRDDNMKERLKVINKRGKHWKVELQSESMPADSV